MRNNGNFHRMQVVVFDLGGTHLRCGVADESGLLGELVKYRLGEFDCRSSADALFADLIKIMTGFVRKTGPSQGDEFPIVLSFPGPVIDRRRIAFAPTLAGRLHDDVDVASMLETATSRKTYLLNDMSAAAWHFADRCDVSRFIVVTVSSGIGAKLFIRENEVGVIDDVEAAGEIGHLVVDGSPNAPQCDCGGSGHLGAIASGRGFERHVRMSARTFPLAYGKSSCYDESVLPEELTNEKHLVPALLNRDQWCSDLLRECTRPLARTLITIAVAAGIERIFVMGGFAQAVGSRYGEILQELLEELADTRLIRQHVTRIVEVASPQEEPSLQGAVAFARSLF